MEDGGCVSGFIKTMRGDGREVSKCAEIGTQLVIEYHPRWGLSNGGWPLEVRGPVLFVANDYSPLIRSLLCARRATKSVADSLSSAYLDIPPTSIDTAMCLNFQFDTDSRYMYLFIGTRTL